MKLVKDYFFFLAELKGQKREIQELKRDLSEHVLIKVVKHGYL